MKEITLFRDFACPFCYIGETRLNQAINDLGISDDVNITFKAYELNPEAPIVSSISTLERIAQKYGMTLEDAEKQIARVTESGKKLGLDFNYATSRYASTRDAHRLFKYAEKEYDKETVDKLNSMLFDAYFEKNLLISDKTVLLAIAEKAGMDKAKTMSLLDSEECLDEVMADEEEAYMKGITGVPYMIIDGKFRIPGAMEYDDYLRFLKD